MSAAPRFRFVDFLFLLLVLALAGGARSWYLCNAAGCGHAANSWRVQDAAWEHDELVANLKAEGILDGFKSHAWLSSGVETTAHVAPGYPLLRFAMEKYLPETLDATANLRWLQVVLGTLAAGCYYLVGRRAFHSSLVGLVAGLGCALNPFWIINCAELNDGALATFLLAASLSLGVRAGQRGGMVTSLFFGVLLAALALVRAALLPFALVAELWFLLRCRRLPGGWFYAILAFLGFISGLAPWTVRNFQQFDNQLIPIVDTAGWHFWVGNNPAATGGPARNHMFHPEALSPERLEELAKFHDKDQPKRYDVLYQEALKEVQRSPGQTANRRLNAMLFFFTGEAFWSDGPLVETSGWEENKDATTILLMEGQSLRVLHGEQPTARETIMEVPLTPILLGTLLLALLGWRWSYGWRGASMPLQLALIWIPLPYVLTHAESLHGPRLPLDGPLVVLAALALVGFIPGPGGRLRQGEPAAAVVPEVKPAAGRPA